MLKKRAMTLTIALILTLTIAIPLIGLPINVNAQLSIDTYAHLAVGSNPIGVGQQLSIVMWLDNHHLYHCNKPQIFERYPLPIIL